MKAKTKKRIKRMKQKIEQKTKSDSLLQSQLEGGKFSTPNFYNESANKLSKRKTDSSIRAVSGGRFSGK